MIVALAHTAKHAKLKSNVPLRCTFCRKREKDICFRLLNKDISVSPNEVKVTEARVALLQQAQFLLSKQQKSMLFTPIEMEMSTDESKTEKEFFIFNCSTESKHMLHCRWSSASMSTVAKASTLSLFRQTCVSRFENNCWNDNPLWECEFKR